MEPGKATNGLQMSELGRCLSFHLDSLCLGTEMDVDMSVITALSEPKGPAKKNLQMERGGSGRTNRGPAASYLHNCR